MDPIEDEWSKEAVREAAEVGTTHLGAPGLPGVPWWVVLPSEHPQRERVKSDLLTFPEAAVLDERQLYEAVDRILKESTPSTATPTAQGMLRFDDECIRETFHCAKWFVTPTTEDNPPSGLVSPGWLEDRRRMLDEEMKPEKRVDPDNSRFLLAKIRVDLLTKGYVEIPKAFYMCFVS
ncbi:hypothetical protein TRIUR3_10436 [Triticum urartu]|uniref:Uncharacterized protein n=1 Tax=Triticum urartu TaxID=4572 RepID=M7ZWV4_TRIUA|nr:hypothetical protein TRIUR3_10436 [Triticum urartu]